MSRGLGDVYKRQVVMVFVSVGHSLLLPITISVSERSIDLVTAPSYSIYVGVSDADAACYGCADVSLNVQWNVNGSMLSSQLSDDPVSVMSKSAFSSAGKVMMPVVLAPTIKSDCSSG